MPCTNRFDTAQASNKKLILMADEDSKPSTLANLKKASGQDKLRAEDKGKKPFYYYFGGMIIVASNNPIFAGEQSSGIQRRILPVPMNNAIPKKEIKDMAALFEGEYAAFTNYLLSLDDDWVSNVIRTGGASSEDVSVGKVEYWEQKIQTSSLAAWVNDKLIFDVMAVAAIGNNKDEKDVTGQPLTLFASYSQYCYESGGNAVSSKRFSPELVEMLVGMGMEVFKRHTERGKVLNGVRLRSPIDSHIPTLDTLLASQLISTQKQADGSADGSLTGRLTGQTLTQSETDGSDGKTNQVGSSLTEANFSNSEPLGEKNIESDAVFPSDASDPHPVSVSPVSPSVSDQSANQSVTFSDRAVPHTSPTPYNCFTPGQKVEVLVGEWAGMQAMVTFHTDDGRFYAVTGVWNGETVHGDYALEELKAMLVPRSLRSDCPEIDRHGGEASVPITTSVETRTTATPNQKFKDKAAQDFIVKILAALVELATSRTQTEVYSKQAVIKELITSAKGLGVIDVVKAGVVAGIANQSSPKQKEAMGYYFGKLPL